MASAKIGITVDEILLAKIDGLVARHVFLNRSQAFQEAIREKLDDLSHNRLARECGKLDLASEQRMADEGMAEDAASWPAY